MPNTYADRLQDILKEKEWSLNDLAEKSGLSYPTLRSYTSKGAMNRKPTLAAAIRIARALEVSLDRFADCTDLQMTKRERKKAGKDGKSGES